MCGTRAAARRAESEMVEQGKAESSSLLTFDLDFGEIMALGIIKDPRV